MRIQKKVFKPLLLTAAFIVIGLFVSCASEPRERRGSLSDAMGKSKDRNTGDRTVPGTGNPDYGNPERQAPRRGSDDDGSTNDESSLPPLTVTDGFLGIRGGRNVVSSGNMGDDVDIDLLAGLNFERVEGLMYAGIKIVDPVEGSSLDESVKDSLGFLRIGGEFRYLPFEDRTYFSPYIGGGLGMFIMGWTFTNSLTDGNEEISGDSLGGFVFSVPVGVYLVRNKTVSFGVSIIPEVYVFEAITSQGFDNDYFKPYTDIKLMGELLFR